MLDSDALIFLDFVETRLFFNTHAFGASASPDKRVTRGTLDALFGRERANDSPVIRGIAVCLPSAKYCLLSSGHRPT